jgi:hypothetical protein
MREVWYKHLESLVLAKRLGDYHDLVEVLNKQWATQLGFQIKQRRPPKPNKDGSQTLRLYCINFLSKSNIEMKRPKEGVEPAVCCPFGITFKYDPGMMIWLLYDPFNPKKMYHNH